MAVSAYINEDLGIRVHRYAGSVTALELVALAQFYRANLPYVRIDLVNLIDEEAGGEEALQHHLKALRSEFRQLNRDSGLVLVRRSAWVCPNLGGWRFLEGWLNERHSRDGQDTEVCLVATLAEADLMFERDELSAIAEWRGFRELFRAPLAS